MKRWIVIRHLRALFLMLTYTWKAAFIWNISTVEELKESGLFGKERDEARRIWRGE